MHTRPHATVAEPASGVEPAVAGPPWGERVHAAARALARARSHALSVTTAIALSGGVAFTILAIRHVERLHSPGDDAVSRLLAGRWPAGWGTSLETPAQHAGILAARDLLVSFAALAVAMACTSIATLVLSRAAARRREVAVRAAVGAAPAAVLRDVALEAALLAGSAVLALALVALVTGGALAGSRPELLRAWLRLRPGVGSFAVGVLAPALALLLFAPLAALPAASSRLARALGMAHATPGPFEGSLRRAFAIAQLAAALSLLIGAGLLLRGADARRTLAADRAGEGVPAAAGRIQLYAVAPEAARGGDARTRAAFYAELLRRIRARPGVAAAGVASPGAWLGQGAEGTVMFTCPRCRIDGIGTPIVFADVQYQLASAGFFAALGIAARGRELAPTEADTAQVVVVNRSFEALFQGVVDPIGQYVRVGSNGTWYRIVGVVPDLRAPGLGASLGAQATLYLPLPAYPPREAELVVRLAPAGAGDDAATARAAAAAGGLASSAGTLAAARARLAAPLEWFGAVTLLVAGVVLLLALHGVAAVAIDDVLRRRRELAIRNALGAAPWRIVASVLGRGVVRVVVGAAWASGGAILVAWLLQRMSPALTLFDAAVYAGALGIITGVSLLASLSAVGTALRVEPREALAEE